MARAMKKPIPTLLVCLMGISPAVYATDFDLGSDLKASFSGTATLGTLIRSDDPNPENYALIPSSTVPGATTGRLMGQTGGSDLNYSKGQAASTVLKVTADLDIHGNDKKMGLFTRVMGWHDFVLGSANAAYGNYPNQFQSNTALDDSGFVPEAKFNNVRFRDAYLYGQWGVADAKTLDARLGRQVLTWGVSQMVAGGINSAIQPTDFAAMLRPGAAPQDSKLPLGMLSASLKLGTEWKLDGFAPYESRNSVLPPCGTYFDSASFVPQGCNMAAAIAAPIAGTPLATLASLTEKSLLTNGLYIHRGVDSSASDSGQAGLALQHTVASWNTDFRGYAMNMHSPIPTYRVTVENNAGGYFPAGLAGGLSRLAKPNGLTYSLAYAENIQVYGASFDTKPSQYARIFGEASYRPNQAVNMNASDVLAAFLLRAPNSLIQVNKNILAVPAGGSFDTFDRFGVSNASLGLNQVLPGALGADYWVLAGELGISKINGLPDQSTMRYGRPLAYGAAAYMLNGAMTACSESAPGLNGVAGKTCTSDGYTTSNAWGYRILLSGKFTKLVDGMTFTPSLYLANDVSGFSYDGTYSQGRHTVRPALRADWGKKFYAEVAYTAMGGGTYDLLSDRSNFTLVAGINF